MAAGHGGNLRQWAIRAGRDPERIIDFSASINPLGPPEGLRAALARGIQHLVHYPDPDCSEPLALLAQRHGVAHQQMVIGNGSTEILFALARAVAFDRAVIPVPAYIDYAATVQAAGRAVVLLPLQEDAGFELDWQTLEASLRGGELVMLGQPNNPTGRTFDPDRFRDLAARHPSTTFVIDEAFADFVDGYRSLAEPVGSNAIVVRSLTKFYAIPGLRLGYAIAPTALAQQIRRQIPPWSVSVLAQHAAVAVLADADYARRSVAFVDGQRRGLTDRLTSIPGLYVYPSATNFLLVRLNRSDLTAPQLADRLLQDGIAIRTFGPGQYLDQRYFRIAVRSEAENSQLCEALAAVLQPGHRRRVKPVRAKALMIQGTSSNAGKSVLTAALCRILLQAGVRVAPFKSQNMSLNSFVTQDGGEMGRAQVVQAQACRLEPDVRMNPVLLKPNSDTGCQVIVNGRPVGNMRVGEYVRYKPEAFAAAKQCYDSLADEFDAIVLEGAGSPGEVNLKQHDIVNMRMAQYAEAPVLVAGDIDRGGVFASFIGTMEVLELWERRLVAGWIVNRFRGDAGLLEPALEYTLRYTGRPVLGVVPYLQDLGLPEEDSVEFKSRALDPRADAGACVEIAVVDLPHISNFTDFDAFRVESDVRLRIVRAADELGAPDAVILPGSKNTLADLAYLRRSGLAARLIALAQQGKTEIIGICGGLQMLGARIADPLAIESTLESARGLELLDAGTVMASDKTLKRGTARHCISGLEVTGYEIHHGQTSSDGCEPCFTGCDGRIVGIARGDHRVWGTYLHGVFDADAFRRWFIDHLRLRQGLQPVGKIVCRYDIEPALDRLAQAVRDHVRIDEILWIMEL